MQIRREEELYVQHVPHAIRLAYLLTGDRSEAEDVAHNAFLATARRRLTLRNPDRFGPYLRRTVVREVLQDRRARDRRRAREARSAPPELASDGSDRIAISVDLIAAMSVLTPRQHAIVVLKYWEDLTEADIAKTVGCKPGTVKSSLSRALEALRSEVDTHA